MRAFACVLLAAASLGGSGCSARGATMVACVGDSITEGDGATSGQATYPGVLQRMLGPKVTVEEFGHSGATLLGPGSGDIPYESQPEFTAALRFVAAAPASARVAVVLMLGTNDSKPHVWDAAGRLERFRADYSRLIDRFAELPSHPTIYLATPLGTGEEPCCGIRGDVLSATIVPAIKALATARGLPLIDLTALSKEPGLLVDGVHPNDRGYELLAAKVREVLVAQPPPAQANAPLWSKLGL